MVHEASPPRTRYQTIDWKKSRETGWEAYVVPFDAWLCRRVGRILKQARLRPEHEQIREIVQDVYCRLLEGGPPRLERLGQLSLSGVLSYLSRVAESTVFDQVRAARTAKRGGTGGIGGIGGQARRLRMSRQTRVRVERLADPTPSPDLRLLQSERRILAVRRLRSLTGSTDRDLRILWLALVEGWPSHELGRAFALKPRSVDNVVLRLRRQIAGRTLELRRRRGV